MNIEVEGLNELVADLARAPFEARVQARGVVQESSAAVKAEAQRLSSGLGHAPHYPRSITYNTVERGIGEVEGEIGPDKDRTQGALGNILEYGTSKNPPFAHLGPALDRETPGFVEAMNRLAGGLL